LIDPRVQNVVRQRVEGTIQTLKDKIQFDASDVLYLDCGNERAPSIDRILPVLKQWADYHRIVIIGFNEDSTLGALDAARLANRENDIAVIGQGADKEALTVLHTPGNRLVGTTAYRPDNYGARLVDLAARILNGEKVPQENFIELEFYTSNSF
jgi:hypothetical protein